MKKIIIILSFFVFANLFVKGQCVPDNAVDNDVTRAIAMVEFDGYKFTGALVNNINEDGRLLFLTSGFPFDNYCNPNGGGMPNSTNIVFTWIDATTTTGATYLAGNDDVALLELNTAPFETYSLLGFNLAGGGVWSYPNYDDGILKQLKVQSAEAGNVTTNCSVGGTTYNFSVGPPALNVLKWVDQVSMKKGEYSKGAPLVTSAGLIAGLYITHRPGGNCTNDSAYFINSPGQLFPNEIGNGSSNLRGIKITPCESIVLENAVIGVAKTVEASVRIIGSSSISSNVLVIFRAGEEIILENGFNSGTNFIAEIEPCFATVEEISRYCVNFQMFLYFFYYLYISRKKATVNSLY